MGVAYKEKHRATADRKIIVALLFVIALFIINRYSSSSTGEAELGNHPPSSCMHISRLLLLLCLHGMRCLPKADRDKLSCRCVHFYGNSTCDALCCCRAHLVTVCSHAAWSSSSRLAGAALVTWRSTEQPEPAASVAAAAEVAAAAT
jgi:hypothetical protein